MVARHSICAIALALATVTFSAAQFSAAQFSAAYAFDDSKYPDLKGQWQRVGVPRWIPPGSAAKPPLTPEYQKVFEENLAEMAAGGMGNVPSWYCLPQGMPMMMNIYDPMEVIVTPATTYILISHINDSYRRIYTDGRDWPVEVTPTFAGYSIGRWIDEDGDGKYDVLEVETRYLKGPRTYDASGIPFHKDNKTIVKERIYLDKKDPNLIYDEVTVLDNALTQPWTSVKKARREPNPHPSWISEACSEDNAFVRIGNEAYYLSADGYLMPTRKGQRPPDARYFDPPGK
jgi:hypothetical protein